MKIKIQRIDQIKRLTYFIISTFLAIIIQTIQTSYATTIPAETLVHDSNSMLLLDRAYSKQEICANTTKYLPLTFKLPSVFESRSLIPSKYEGPVSFIQGIVLDSKCQPISNAVVTLLFIDVAQLQCENPINTGSSMSLMTMTDFENWNLQNTILGNDLMLQAISNEIIKQSDTDVVKNTKQGDNNNSSENCDDQKMNNAVDTGELARTKRLLLKKPELNKQYGSTTISNEELSEDMKYLRRRVRERTNELSNARYSDNGLLDSKCDNDVQKNAKLDISRLNLRSLHSSLIQLNIKTSLASKKINGSDSLSIDIDDDKKSKYKRWEKIDLSGPFVPEEVFIEEDGPTLGKEEFYGISLDEEADPNKPITGTKRTTIKQWRRDCRKMDSFMDKTQNQIETEINIELLPYPENPIIESDVKRQRYGRKLTTNSFAQDISDKRKFRHKSYSDDVSVTILDNMDYDKNFHDVDDFALSTVGDENDQLNKCDEKKLSNVGNFSAAATTMTDSDGSFTLQIPEMPKIRPYGVRIQSASHGNFYTRILAIHKSLGINFDQLTNLSECWLENTAINARKNITIGGGDEGYKISLILKSVAKNN